MPYVAFNTADASHIGLLTRRVLIGRQLPHGVVLADLNVSRLHAWLDPVADGWVITDAGSKSGTFVNGKQVYRHELCNEDEIRVGEIRLVYHTETAPPANVAVVDLSEPNGVIKPSGLLFDCVHCGAPMWVSNNLAGKRGLCRHCRKPVTVPAVEPETPPAVEPVKLGPAPAAAITTEPAKARREVARCAVCHGDIQPEDTETTCPECAMHFHSECWQENFGCSSYGCPQVDVLNPNPKTAETIAAVVTEPTANDEVATELESASTSPLATVALAASVLASLVGAILFGIPAAIVAIATIVLMVRGNSKKAVLAVALLICLAGVAGGLIASDFYYYSSRHLPFKFRP